MDDIKLKKNWNKHPNKDSYSQMIFFFLSDFKAIEKHRYCKYFDENCFYSKLCKKLFNDS